jgi:hypothetical protein
MKLNSTFSFDELNIKKETINRLLGYKDQPVDEYTNELIDKAFYSASKIQTIRGAAVVFNSFKLLPPGTISIENQTINLGNKIFTSLIKSESLLVFLATAGEGIEVLKTEKQQEGDEISAYIFDLLGSEIAEEASVKIVDNLLKKLDDPKLKRTMKFSPGYCDWPISNQKEMFELLDPHFCKISLTDAYMMNPVKSVNGITGIGPDVKLVEHQCKVCNYQNCMFKNLKIK